MTLNIYDKCVNNIQTIESIMKDSKTVYPSLHRILKRIWFDLRDFLKHAATTSISEEYHEFFVSSRYLEEHFLGSHSHWNRNINVFATLGLIKRVPYDESAISLNDEYAHAEDDDDPRKPVNVYQIPNYDSAVLQTADERAKIMYEHGYRLSAFGKIFLIKTFGQEFANTVFPDNRSVTVFSEYVVDQITKRILKDIEKHGYSTKQRVLDKTRINLQKVTSQEYGFHRDSKENILRREFDRSIKDICDAYGLEYRKANKAIMDRLNLKKPITVICKVK